MEFSGFFHRRPILSLGLLILAFTVNAQCPTQKTCWDRLIAIENRPVNELGLSQKYAQLVAIRQQMEDCRLDKDSVYARLLHRAALYRSQISGDWERSIDDTRQAVAINVSGKPGACLRFAASSYFNLGHYYQLLLFYDEALHQFDSSLLVSRRFPGQENLIIMTRENTSNIFDNKGDFQRSAEEATLGLQVANTIHDTSSMIIFLNQRAYAEIQQNQFEQAAADAAAEASLSDRAGNNAGKAGSTLIQAQINITKGRIQNAFASFQLAIRYSAKTNDQVMLAEDYLDAGNFLVDKLCNYSEAKKCYTQAIKLSIPSNDFTITAKAFNNMGSANFYEKNYLQAIYYYSEALAWLKIQKNAQVLENPGATELNRFQNKQILLHLFGNKTECLLHLYKQNHQKQYLKACLRTALLTDTLIATMRHEQTGEQSKLYWRNQTREFFGNALEACWLAEDAGLAFYFMEKSRAVLLNDKLNELGAFSLLPAPEAAKEQSLQIAMIEQQQALSQLNADSPAYQTQRVKFLGSKDELERYIKTLEQLAPAYYQYKYADEVPTLASFERTLSGKQQSFIHYFLTDTLLYALSISGKNARLLRLPCQGLNNELAALLRICSDKQTLNNDYGAFAALSNNIYRALFQPLQIPKGRVAICPDNFLIPFEALCTDSAGRSFLVYDYTFDYVYSARYLDKSFDNPAGKGNFLGLAPASFAAYLQVPALQGSVPSLRTAASCYSGYTCRIGPDANRKCFMEEAPSYAIVNLYSHARADSGDNEPLLFMADSVIRLSELQLLQHPAAQLVVLSACQTNAGRNAAGEGIYSLARGFASAGIPAVSSTIWRADEKAIYEITELFHQGLAKGMRKDDALRSAKLQFIRSGGNDHLLPYYWANMILTGNADPVKLSPPHSSWWVIFGLVAALFCIGYTTKRVLFK